MEQQAQQAQTAPANNSEQIVANLLNAIESRTQRATNGIYRSFEEQYGMSETELRELVAKHKAEKDSKPTEAQQRAMDEALTKANQRLIASEVKVIGKDLGLVDSDVAMQLMDKTKVKVNDDGSVEGVKEALEALQKSKAYLFTASEKPVRTGMRQTKESHEEDKAERFNKALRQALGKE